VYEIHNSRLARFSIDYADVLEHASHTAYIKDSFSVSFSQSCVMCSLDRL